MYSKNNVHTFISEYVKEKLNANKVKTTKKNDSYSKTAPSKSVPSKPASDSKQSWKTERPNVKLVETLKPDWNKVRDRSTKDKARETTIKKMMVMQQLYAYQYLQAHFLQYLLYI